MSRILTGLLCVCLSVWLWALPVAVSNALLDGSAFRHFEWSTWIIHATSAQAEPADRATPTEILARLFTEESLQQDWFADSFLAQISLAEIAQITQGIVSSVGTYQSIEDVPNGFVLTFDRGTVATHLALNPQGQITGLLFETPQLMGLSVEESLQEMAALPGKVHVLAMRGGREVAALNADEALAE